MLLLPQYERALLFDPGGTSALGHCRASILPSAKLTASAPLIGEPARHCDDNFDGRSLHIGLMADRTSISSEGAVIGKFTSRTERGMAVEPREEGQLLHIVSKAI